MKKECILVLTVFFIIQFNLSADFLHTTDRKVYEGKMVAFKYNLIYFNVYKFGKFHQTMRFPLHKVWKVEFNTPKKEGLQSPYEIEANYRRLRRGKRVKKIILKADQNWVDTGINVKIGQNILFSTSGSIYIDKETRIFQNGELNLTRNKNKPLPTQPTGAIIARIGKKGLPFYVGNDKLPFTTNKKGRLYVGINDYNFEDNSGQFNVTIYY